MKIANKISFSFLVVAFILSSAGGAVFYFISKDSLQRSIYNNLVAVAASRTEHIETYLKMLEVSVGQFSKSVVLENLLKTGATEPSFANAFEDAMRRLRRTQEANPSIAEFLLLDKTGRVLASSDKSSVGLDKSSEEYFSQGREGIYVEDVHYSEARKEPLIAISAPVVDSHSNEFLGEIAAWSKLNDLNDIVTNRTGLGQTGEIYIVNKNGYMITPSRFREGAVLKQKVENENVREAWLYKTGKHQISVTKTAYVYSGYRGVQVLGVNEFIPRMRWAVLAVIDKQEAFAPLNRLQVVFYLIIILVSFSSWLLGKIISRLITGPLLKLSDGAEIIGKGNLDYNIATGDKDEVGHLSRTFEKMMLSLKKTTTSVDNLNIEIAERKRAEEALVESEKRFMDVMYASQDAILLIDGNIFVDCNIATARMLGYSDRKEFLMTHPSKLSPPVQPDGKNSFEKAEEMMKIASEKGFNRFEWIHRKAKGEDFPVEVSLTPIALHGKNVIYCVWRDITERKKAEGQLKQAQAQLVQSAKMASVGQLAGGVAHEINNPLTGILNNVQLIKMISEQKKEFNLDDFKELLNVIEESAVRCAGITRSLLDFSRASNEKKCDVSLNEIIEKVCELMATELRLNSITIRKELDPGLPLVNGDLQLLQQVVFDIISNAKWAISQKTGKQGGQVTVKTGHDAQNHSVYVLISDTGIGIPKENLERIFEPFFTTKPVGEGTGLGLAIVYSIIKDHKGTLEVQSEVGQGSSFKISLPAVL